MLRRYKLHVDVYKSTVNLCIGPRASFEKLMTNRHAPKNGYVVEPGVEGRYAAVDYDSTGEAHFYIWMEEFSGTIAQQGVLAHELLHYLFDLHRRRDIPLHEASEESFTYTFQHLLCQALAKLNSLR